ncbi:MAG: TRAP transporter permease [Candidatus Puniceispirillaceae bacterium]
MSMTGPADSAGISPEDFEGGARRTGRLAAFVCILWSLFQLWVASDFPFYLSEVTGLKLVFNNQEARQIHLAFGLGLALSLYPAVRSVHPLFDRLVGWGFAIIGVTACLYLFIFKLDIANRAGLPNRYDLFFSIAGMLCVMVAVYRALGLPLLIVAMIFIIYVMFGHLDFFPDAMRWKGASLNKATWHFWMQTEGVFGVALGVSASMIFLFVLFGALLESAGAGNYFIKLSFAALGHLRGGPAKAAVVASGLSGIYSGSSIANVVTTGTFTIPLMKKTGLSAEKAGAVEVASSTNGQLTPPVMGAAAFLIAEFTGISYFELIKHAALPALVSYVALFYIVHIEVTKLGLTGLPRQTPTQGLLRRATGFLVGFAALALIAAVFHLLVSLVGDHAPAFSLPLVIVLLLAIYLPLVWLAAQRPDLGEGLSEDEMKMLPRVGDVAVTGYHFVLPILTLLWCVLVSRLSPGLSAYWACLAMMFVLVTQHPLKALFRGQAVTGQHWGDGWRDLLRGLENGARNMISIAIATAIAGIIIGTVSLTGAHQFIGSFVETVSAGNLVIMLLLVAVMSLVLGMGLPTTANYIVVSSLMAPVIVMVGAQNGLIVPLVAVHLFVFYFGILADDTPPVGLAAFAAAAISRGDPIRTGIQGFSYDIRTAVLPFMFIFNTDILLIDVGLVGGLVAVTVTTIGMLAFCSATQRFMLTRNRLWETLILLLVAFTMFRPDFWLDRWVPPFDMRPGAEIVDLLEADSAATAPRDLRVRFVGPDFDDASRMVTRNTIIQVPPTDDAFAGLADAGVVMTLSDGVAIVEEPFPGTPLFQELQGFDFYADDPVTLDLVLVEIADRPAREWVYLPAVFLLGLVLLLQRRRKVAAAT